LRRTAILWIESVQKFGCFTPELNAVCPNGFEYHFIDEEFVVGREFGLASE
jgi:hypothetical protein